MATKIRKDQIRIEEFIQAMAGVNWSSDTLTASAAAIASKIQTEIAGVAGAMLYRGAWSTASTDTIKKGYVYVYAGSTNGSIGTGAGTVTLEPGDMAIANRDSASVSDPSHWTVVNVNITGAITEANLVDQLYAALSNGNTNALTIAKDTSTNKVKLTVKFPTISSGSAVTGKYISGLAINATTGAITITRADLPDMGANCMVLNEIPTGSVNGDNLEFLTANAAHSAKHTALYINGLRQLEGVDYTVESSTGGKLKFSISSGAYIPNDGDVVTVDYMAKNHID